MEHHQSRQPYELGNQPEQPSTVAEPAPEQLRTREQVIRQRIEQAELTHLQTTLVLCGTHLPITPSVRSKPWNRAKKLTS